MKIKVLFFNILALVGCLVFASCSQDVEVDELIDSGKYLNLEIAMDEPATRSIITSTTFKDGDKIGIIVKNVNKENVAYNYCATRVNGSWELSTPIKLDSYTGGDSLSVYAYYPYSSEVSKKKNDSIDISVDFVNGEQTDYLYGSVTGITAKNNVARILFKHALARVTLKISNSSSRDVVVSEVSLENDSIFSQNLVIVTTDSRNPYTPIGNVYKNKDSEISLNGKICLLDGIVDKNVDRDAVLQITCDEFVIPANGEKVIDILAEPVLSGEAKVGETGGGRFFKIVVDGVASKIKVDGYWEAGRQYTYPITLSERKVQARVGDYYYSDGSCSSVYTSSKKCLGVVFALTDEKDGEINRELVTSEHGRVVACSDLPSSPLTWGPKPNTTYNTSRVGTTEISNSLSYEIDDNGVIRSWPTNRYISYFDGLTETKGISSNVSYPAAYNCTLYMASTSDSNIEWYLPSSGELKLISLLYNRSFIDSKYSKFNSGNYWTSTEWAVVDISGKDEKAAIKAIIYASYLRTVICVNVCTGSISLQEKTTKQKVRPAMHF